MRSLLVVSALLSSLAVSAVAQGKGKGKGQDKRAEPTVAASLSRGAILFSEEEKEYIRVGYAQTPPPQRPPGWPKGSQLPPGLRNKLQRGGKLPPGWLKRLTPFPPFIDKRMQIDPPHVRRGFIEGYVVIVDSNTEVVLDVMLPYVN